MRNPATWLEVKILSIKLAIPYATTRSGPGRVTCPTIILTPKNKIIPLDEKRMVANLLPASKSAAFLFSAAWATRRRKARAASTARPPWIMAGNSG